MDKKQSAKLMENLKKSMSMLSDQTQTVTDIIEEHKESGRVPLQRGTGNYPAS